MSIFRSFDPSILPICQKMINLIQNLYEQILKVAWVVYLPLILNNIFIRLFCEAWNCWNSGPGNCRNSKQRNAEFGRYLLPNEVGKRSQLSSSYRHVPMSYGACVQLSHYQSESHDDNTTFSWSTEFTDEIDLRMIGKVHFRPCTSYIFEEKSWIPSFGMTSFIGQLLTYFIAKSENSLYRWAYI